MSVSSTEFNCGNGLKFDGVNDYVQATTPNLLFPINTAYSFSFICGIISGQIVNSGLMIGNNTGLTNGIYIQNRYNFLQFSLTKTFSTNRLYVLSSQNLSSGVYHIVITKSNLYNLSAINFYINSVIQSKFAAYDNLTDLTFADNSLNLNGGSGIGYYNDRMYDLKVFNKELTQAEVTELYNKQGQIVPASAMSSLQLDYRFNNKSGTVLTDKSINGYNGTLVNYAAGTTTLGATNSWCDKYGNAITAY